MMLSRSTCPSLGRKWRQKLSSVLKISFYFIDICFSFRDTWKKITVTYNSKTKEDRHYEALRKKWLEVVHTRIPTGDPDIPEHVRIAKKLFRAADQVAEVGQGDPNDDDSQDSGHDSSYLESQRQYRTPSGVKFQDREKRRRLKHQLQTVDEKFKEGDIRFVYYSFPKSYSLKLLSPRCGHA